MIINNKNIDAIRGKAYEIDACISIVIIEEALARGIRIELPFGNFKLMWLYVRNDGKPTEIRRVTTHDTSAVSLAMTLDKALCYRVAESLGMILMPWVQAVTEKSALEFYHQQQGNCIIKPVKGQGGRGIITSFTGQEDFIDKFRILAANERVIVQAKSDGKYDIRLLFIDQMFVAATSTRPTELVGDGQQTLSELIHSENVRRSGINANRYPTMPLKELSLDTAVNISGFLGNQIVPSGNRIDVSLSNVTRGGISSDITSSIHTSFITEAQKLVNRLALPVVAVDFMAEQVAPDVDIADSNACFLEANATPGIDMHMYPHEGEGVNAASLFIDYLIKK